MFFVFVWGGCGRGASAPPTECEREFARPFRRNAPYSLGGAARKFSTEEMPLLNEERYLFSLFVNGGVYAATNGGVYAEMNFQVGYLCGI